MTEIVSEDLETKPQIKERQIFGLASHESPSIDENEFKVADSTSAATPQRYSVVGECNINLEHDSVLLDRSKNYENNTKQCQTPFSDKELDPAMIIEKPRKRPIPLLQRLKVIKAAQKAGTVSPKKPLPQEVVVDSDGDGVAPAVTAFSELGFEGISSARSRSMERRSPMRFTFDGIVSSNSSLSGIDIPPDGIVLARSGSHNEKVASPCFPGLEYEAEDGIVPQSKSMDHESPSPLGYKEITADINQERVRSATESEMSIELSESQYLRNCERLVPDKYKIFSPQTSWASGEKERPIDHGFDRFVESSRNSKTEKKAKAAEVTSSPWMIDFSFFSLW